MTYYQQNKEVNEILCTVKIIKMKLTKGLLMMNT